MSETGTRTITPFDPETGEEHEVEIPNEHNRWVYQPNHPEARGNILWVDPYDDDRYITVSKTGGHTWVAELNGDDEDERMTASTIDTAVGHAKTLMMSRRVRAPTEESDEIERGQTVTRALYDGSIRFMPPYTKKAAEYQPLGSDEFDQTHDRCGSCVHFIEGGGCHLVQGDIDPEAYCEEFYADYGVFAHEHDDFVEVNAELVGPDWDFSERSIEEFVDDLEERLQQRRRELEAETEEGE